MATVIGVLEFSLSIQDAQSLKEKRRVVRSIKDRLAHRHNISIAEVADQDVWQRATLALACVGNEDHFVRGILEEIVRELDRHAEAILVDYDLELL